MSKVLVYVNQQEGNLTSNAREALTFGRRIVDSSSNGEVRAVIISPDAEEGAKEAIACGADKVYTIDHSLLVNYQSDYYIEALSTVFQQSDTDFFIIPFDRQGKDLVGRIATKLSASALTEVVDFIIEDGRLKWVRPIYGEKVYGEYRTNRKKTVIGIRPKSNELATPDERRKGEVVSVDCTISEDMKIVELLEKIDSTLSGVRLEDARVIVSGGKGLDGPEGFKEIQELADVLGGAVGASRAACDAGWIESHLQIGQTGAIVAPDLYIAVGISGAGQHLSGITSAKTVVAINTDEEAAIFNRANIGIVADYKKVVPALTKEIRKRLAVKN